MAKPENGGIKGKDGTTRGGTKGGRVYVKTDRAGSDATSTKQVPSGGKTPPALRGADAVSSAPKSGSSSLPATRSEVVRDTGGSRGSSAGTEVGRGPKDIGSGKTVGAMGGNQLGGPKATTAPAPVGALARLVGLGRMATGLGAAAAVMAPSETNAGEAEWLAKNKGQNASMGASAPTPAPSPAPVRRPPPQAPAQRPAPSRPPVRTAAPAPSAPSMEDKIGLLVQKGFALPDAVKLAGAQSTGPVSAPQGYAKGGMVKKAAAPKAPGKSLFNAAVPTVPNFGKDLGKAAAVKPTAPVKSNEGMPRMPKMPATGKAAMTNKMAAITKPKKIK